MLRIWGEYPPKCTPALYSTATVQRDAYLSGQVIKRAASTNHLHDAFQSEYGTALVDFTVGVKETCLQEGVIVWNIPPVEWGR